MPVVPTPPTIAPGILTSSKLNQIRDVERFYGNPPTALLRQTSPQSIPNSVWTSINFDVEDVDSDVDLAGGHSTSVNTSRYTARYPGWYLVSGGITWSTAGFRPTRWAVNGVALIGTSIGDSSSQNVPARTHLVYLAAGHFVELQGFQNSGGALNTAADGADNESTMTVKWVSI